MLVDRGRDGAPARPVHGRAGRHRRPRLRAGRPLQRRAASRLRRGARGAARRRRDLPRRSPRGRRRRAATPLEDELHVLCAHGVLHLLGYDHAEPDEEREMFAVQGRVLDVWHEQRPGPSGSARRWRAARGGDGRRDRSICRCWSARRCWSSSPRRSPASTAPSPGSRRVTDRGVRPRGRPRAAAAVDRSSPTPPRYLNLLLLLRMACEIGATVPGRAGDGARRRRRARRGRARRRCVMTWSPTSSSASRSATLGRQHAERASRCAPPRSRAGLGPGVRAAAAAADPARQRDHARPRLPRRPVRDRGRAARAGRPRPRSAAWSSRTSAT